MTPLSPKMAKVAFGYGTAALVQGLVAFLAVPMLIVAIGPDSFALWAIVEPLVGLGAMTALLGASHGHLRALAMRQAVSAQVFCIQARYGTVPALAVSLLTAAAAVHYLEPPQPMLFCLLAAFYVFCEAVIALSQAVARGEDNAIAYATSIWIKFGLLGTGLLVCSWSGQRFSLVRYLEGLIVLDLLVIASVVWRYGNRPVPVEWQLAYSGAATFRAAIRYGWPINVAAALVMVAANGDRYVVHALMPEGQLAGYVTMAKLAGALSFSAAPVALWWPAARFRHAADLDGGANFYNAATTVLMLYYLTVSVMVWLLAPIVIGAYAPGVASYDSMTMLTLLCAATASAMVTPMNIGTLNQGKTHWAIWTVGTSAAVGVGLAVILLPLIGYAGAAAGAVCSQLTALALTHFASQRIQYVRFDYRKPALLLALFGLGILIIAALNESLWSSAGVLLVCLTISCFISLPEIRKMLE